MEHRTLRKAGKDVHLSPKEFEILALLMEHQNVPLTHAKILRTVWGPEYGDEPEYLGLHKDAPQEDRERSNCSQRAMDASPVWRADSP